MEADCNLEEVCLMKVGRTELSALVNVTVSQLERNFLTFELKPLVLFCVIHRKYNIICECLNFDTSLYEIWMICFTCQDPVSRSVNGVGWALMSDEESLQKAVDFYNSGEVHMIELFKRAGWRW